MKKLAERILESKNVESIDEGAHASQGLNFDLGDDLRVHVNYSCGVNKRNSHGEFIDDDDIETQTKVKEAIQSAGDTFMKSVGATLKKLQSQLS